MTWIVEKRQVRADNGSVCQFDFEIREAKEAGDVLVVVLEVPRGRVMTENVFGVCSEGKLLWQIERIPETSSSSANRYMDIVATDSGRVRLGNWNGGLVDVDPATGKAVWTGWGK